MIVRSLLVLIASIIVTNTVHAFALRPSLSVWGSYTSTQNYVDISAGGLGISNRKLNPGVELTNKFYIHDNWFIKSGFRYTQYGTTIVGDGQLPVGQANGAHLYWESGLESFAVPVLLGRDFETAGGRKGDFYAGISSGIIMLSYMKSGISSDRDFNSTDRISATFAENAGKTGVGFFPTADIGVNWQPFRNVPRINAGAFCSIQLNKTPALAYEGKIKNETTGSEYNYNFTHRQSVINYGLSVTYIFGSPAAARAKGGKVEL